MLHENKEEFLEVLNRAAMGNDFYLPHIEKDYYLTLILSRIHDLSEDLIFKGGHASIKFIFLITG